MISLFIAMLLLTKHAPCDEDITQAVGMTLVVQPRRKKEPMYLC